MVYNTIFNITWSKVIFLYITRHQRQFDIAYVVEKLVSRGMMKIVHSSLSKRFNFRILAGNLSTTSLYFTIIYVPLSWSSRSCKSIGRVSLERAKHVTDKGNNTLTHDIWLPIAPLWPHETYEGSIYDVV